MVCFLITQLGSSVTDSYSKERLLDTKTLGAQRDWLARGELIEKNSRSLGRCASRRNNKRSDIRSLSGLATVERQYSSSAAYETVKRSGHSDRL